MITSDTLYEQDEHLYELDCPFRSSKLWDFGTFRQMTSQLPDFSYNIALNISCNHTGKISLPWPMRASRLRFLTVDKCHIYNYSAEFVDESILSIPDSLRYFKFIDPIIHQTLSGLIREYQMGNNRSHAAKCGPEKVYYWGLQNITYIFPRFSLRASNSSQFKMLRTVAKAYLGKTKKESKINCVYENLKVYDHSRSNSIGKDTIRRMVREGKYPELLVFNLSRTNVLEIPELLQDWRLYFPKLMYLDLRYNNIKDFRFIVDYDDSDKKNKSVGVIDLRNNNITSISYRTLRSMRHHGSLKVDIRDNPISCVCEMREFVHYLKKPNNNFTLNAHVTGNKYLYLRDLTCANPPHVRGRRILSLSDRELGCEKEISFIEEGPVIALSFIIILVLCTAFLFIRYREEITILAFTRLNIILPCHATEHDDAKKYDAFVAYSQYDAVWVVNTLRRRLENPDNGAPFKLCLHHRDFEVGAAIFDNIMSSVKNSRHTILVLSRNFLQSEWCIMEFRTAFHQSLLERKKHLIIALLEDIPEEEMDLDLKRCLKTLTYVEAGDHLFWDKLIYALSSKKRRTRKNDDVVGELV
ncbi:hypothetical protein FSP39_003251 [Pinctada imbricata]|uniref:TIR domain-containing protein n=1 Tax=Pinctada imbricata TaxID=66713 RepID=A0AA88XJA8_PINIB|nr:hypothetical protein FSP39_003251 [Pinctada imbricata]